MVSIISAIYKSERYLPSFLRNVQKCADFLNKKNFPFEIVIIATMPSRVEKGLLSSVKSQSWCFVYEFGETGLYKAWNYGVSVAKGEVMGPWNADDVRFPEAVMEAQSLAEEEADVSYYPFYLKRYVQVGPFDIPVITRKVEGEILTFEKRKFEISMIAGPHFMFTRRAYQMVGPFDEQFKIAGDFDWCARAAAAGVIFKSGKNFSGIFRVDGRGLSAGANKRLQAENNIIYARHHAPEKMFAGVKEEMKEYKLDQLLVHGEWKSLVL